MKQNIFIIILNWNGLKDTIECLESVKKINYLNYQIIVVDNGSTDNSVSVIKEKFPNITLISNNRNVGFAEGNNVGIRYALKHGADYVFLLNNDTTVDPEILNNLISTINKYPEAGILGAKIYYYSEPNKIWFAGGKWNDKDKNFYHLGFSEVDNENKFSNIIDIDYACGCALFIKREVIEKAGVMDSKYFLLFEETDWCYKVKKLGYKILLEPNAKVWHKISSTFSGQKSPIYIYYFTRNKLLWAKNYLNRKDRKMIFNNILKTFFYHSFSTDPTPLIKRFYWDLRNNFRDKLITCSKLIAIFNFLTNSFGECPKIMYKLQKKYKTNV